MEDVAAVRARGGEAADADVAEQTERVGWELGAGLAAAGGRLGGQEQRRAACAVVSEDRVRVLDRVARVEEGGTCDGAKGRGDLGPEYERCRCVWLQGAVVVQDFGSGDGHAPDVE